MLPIDKALIEHHFVIVCYQHGIGFNLDTFLYLETLMHMEMLSYCLGANLK